MLCIGRRTKAALVAYCNIYRIIVRSRRYVPQPSLQFQCSSFSRHCASRSKVRIGGSRSRDYFDSRRVRGKD